MTTTWFEHYRAKADEAVAAVERLQEQITRYAQRARVEYGESALTSVKLSKDIAFMDTVSDRNRYIQLAIMYSNMAVLHRE